MQFDLTIRSATARDRSATAEGVDQLRHLPGAASTEFLPMAWEADSEYNFLAAINFAGSVDDLRTFWKSLTLWAREGGWIITLHDRTQGTPGETIPEVDLDSPGEFPGGFTPPATPRPTREPSYDTLLSRTMKQFMTPRGFKPEGKARTVRTVNGIRQTVEFQKGIRSLTGSFTLNIHLDSVEPGTEGLVASRLRVADLLGMRTDRWYSSHVVGWSHAMERAVTDLVGTVLPFLDAHDSLSAILDSHEAGRHDTMALFGNRGVLRAPEAYLKLGRHAKAMDTLVASLENPGFLYTYIHDPLASELGQQCAEFIAERRGLCEAIVSSAKSAGESDLPDLYRSRFDTALAPYNTALESFGKSRSPLSETST